MKGAGGRAAARLVLDPRNRERLRPETRQRGVRPALVARPEGLAVAPDDLETAGLRVAGACQIGEDLPVLLRLEDANLPLALHHQPHRHRLDPAGGQPAGHLRPEQRRHLEAHHPVEKPPRLLGVHPVLVDLAGIVEGVLNGPPGDLVEHHAPEALRVAADHLLEMPGDGFSFAVEVGGEKDLLGGAGQLLELADHLLLAGHDLVGRAPAAVRIDAHALHELAPRPLPGIRGTLAGRLPAARRRLAPPVGLLPLAARRQVTNVPDAGLDEVLLAQVAVDGAGFGRRLDDYQGSGHGPPVAVETLLPSTGHYTSIPCRDRTNRPAPARVTRPAISSSVSLRSNVAPSRPLRSTRSSTP